MRAARNDPPSTSTKPTIVTQVTPLKAFYLAEDYHQDYMRLNPDAMYIAVNDRPKVLALERIYPERYVASWANGR